MTAIVEARAIERREAGGGWLLRGLSLEIGGGDRIALAGPSGAGKTVLLRALSMLDSVQGGEILLDGRPVRPADTPSYRRRVAYLHQNPALVDGTVEANLKMPFTLAAHRRRGFDRARAVELLARLGRDEGLLERQRGELSGGEGQIVALVRLLQLEPSVLLLDEPTAALDPDAVKAATAVLRDWQGAAADRAYLWVTHDSGLSRRVADRRLRLDAGELTVGS